MSPSWGFFNASPKRAFRAPTAGCRSANSYIGDSSQNFYSFGRFALNSGQFNAAIAEAERWRSWPQRSGQCRQAPQRTATAAPAPAGVIDGLLTGHCPGLAVSESRGDLAWTHRQPSAHDQLLECSRGCQVRANGGLVDALLWSHRASRLTAIFSGVVHAFHLSDLEHSSDPRSGRARRGQVPAA